MVNRDMIVIGGCLAVAVVARLLQVSSDYPPRGVHSFKVTPWLFGFAAVLVVLAYAIPKWLPPFEATLFRLGWIRELSPIWGYRLLAFGLTLWARWIIIGFPVAALFYFFVWRELP